MWYAIQITIAVYLAYVWCTMPDHNPGDLGRGLFLGAIVAWSVTAFAVICIDSYKRIRRRRLTLIERKPKSLGPVRTLLNWRGH